MSNSTSVTDTKLQPMSFAPNPVAFPDMENLPLKKRDQRWIPPPRQLQQQSNATFKAPYPYKSHTEFKTKQPGSFQPLPKWVPALYHPWTQASTQVKPQVLTALGKHHNWDEWRESSPLCLKWDVSHHSHLSGTATFPSRLGPGSLVEGFHTVGGGYGYDHLKSVVDKRFSAEPPSRRRNEGPYVRRADRNSGGFEKTAAQRNGLHKSSQLVRCPVIGRSLTTHDKSRNTCSSRKEDTSGSPALQAPSSSSPNRFPWLLPHFVAGSLIELRDGRLRKVEHLQMEDFLMGSLACPDLHLSSCTVKNIFPSSSSSHSSSFSSRLLILLHNQRSQELVDVYDEYPFFVRGQGWSSCSPERTARLCGLQCRQLSVGDVCLALTPVSVPQCLPSEPKTRNAMSRSPEAGNESPNATQPQIPTRPERPAGKQAVRRRRYSAPELSVPGTHCMK